MSLGLGDACEPGSLLAAKWFHSGSLIGFLFLHFRHNKYSHSGPSTRAQHHLDLIVGVRHRLQSHRGPQTRAGGVQGSNGWDSYTATWANPKCSVALGWARCAQIDLSEIIQKCLLIRSYHAKAVHVDRDGVAGFCVFSSRCLI